MCFYTFNSIFLWLTHVPDLILYLGSERCQNAYGTQRYNCWKCLDLLQLLTCCFCYPDWCRNCVSVSTLQCEHHQPFAYQWLHITITFRAATVFQLKTKNALQFHKRFYPNRHDTWYKLFINTTMVVCNTICKQLYMVWYLSLTYHCILW